MIPGNLPFTLRQGESFGQEIYFKYEDIYIEIDKTVTATLKPGSYVYDLFITDGGGIAKPFLAGSFNIAAGITQ
jgi:hypothetical protein